MFMYLARDKAPRDAAGAFVHAKGAVFHKRGEVGPTDDPVGYRRMMEDRHGLAVQITAQDLGDVIDTDGKTIHKRVERRPGRAAKVLE